LAVTMIMKVFVTVFMPSVMVTLITKLPTWVLCVGAILKVDPVRVTNEGRLAVPCNTALMRVTAYDSGSVIEGRA